MPRYDMKCSWCNHEEEIWKAANDVVSCTKPDNDNCPGVMEVVFRTPPALTRAACPTRQGQNDGVSYKVSKPVGN